MSSTEHSSHAPTTRVVSPAQKLGKGTFGAAVLLVKEETKEQYCGKLIKYKHMQPAEKEHVAREVRTMAHLSAEGGHPYIVRFRESFVLSTGPLCIVMELCDGGDLGQLVATAKKKRTGFSEEQVHLWLLQMLAATDFLHTHRILHRDIKPANVFMHSGVCKLGDLGLSKQIMMASTQPGAHTQCGSPLYLAPEVHMGMQYSKQIDMWAIGCTIFEVMMLAHAFQGSDNARILQNIVWARHADIDGRWSDSLSKMVDQMLALKPEARPDACTLIKDPLFAPALQSGHLHPGALRHQQELAHIVLAESPTSIVPTEGVLGVDCKHGQGGSRPSSAPSGLARYFFTSR